MHPGTPARRPNPAQSSSRPHHVRHFVSDHLADKPLVRRAAGGRDQQRRLAIQNQTCEQAGEGSGITRRPCTPSSEGGGPVPVSGHAAPSMAKPPNSSQGHNPKHNLVAAMRPRTPVLHGAGGKVRDGHEVELGQRVGHGKAPLVGGQHRRRRVGGKTQAPQPAHAGMTRAAGTASKTAGERERNASSRSPDQARRPPALLPPGQPPDSRPPLPQSPSRLSGVPQTVTLRSGPPS